MITETTAVFSRKKYNSWSEMCGKETKGSRWQGSSPGTGEVVLKWYFLADRWLSGKEIWGCSLLSLCSSGYPVPLLRYIWIFRIRPSPGENIQNQGTLLLNDFKFIRSSYQKIGVCLVTVMRVKKLYWFKIWIFTELSAKLIFCCDHCQFPHHYFLNL